MSSTAWAAASPKQTFDFVNDCLEFADAEQCRTLLTAESLPVYDRFVAHDLMRCLPKQVTYISEETSGNKSVIRTGVNAGEHPRSFRMVLMKNNANWQLDMVETLRLGLGKNWEKQLNMTEQLYLVMKQQMGKQLNCDMLHELVKMNQR